MTTHSYTTIRLQDPVMACKPGHRLTIEFTGSRTDVDRLPVPMELWKVVSGDPAAQPRSCPTCHGIGLTDDCPDEWHGPVRASEAIERLTAGVQVVPMVIRDAGPDVEVAIPLGTVSPAWKTEVRLAPGGQPVTTVHAMRLEWWPNWSQVTAMLLLSHDDEGRPLVRTCLPSDLSKDEVRSLVRGPRCWFRCRVIRVVQVY